MEKRGSIAFFATYRPPVPLDLYSCPIPPASNRDELRLTDGRSYNYNAQAIPPASLKAILKRPQLASLAKDADVDSGRVTGLIFVSERTDNLETLHVALRFGDGGDVKVFNFAELYGTFKGVRLEDHGCFAGDSIIYISTKEPADRRRQPWTAVYKTNLKTGKTDRLTPEGEADLSPAVSPSGKRIAMASFELKDGWDGEIEDLKTDIFVMNVEKPFGRKRLIANGGWPTWGSNDVLFFHRNVPKKMVTNGTEKEVNNWAVFRADLSKGGSVAGVRVTPDSIDAVTPAAMDATKVAVATIRQKSQFTDVRVEAQYRHIEIFDSANGSNVQITQKTRPKADHYNPFFIVDKSGRQRVGYHRTRSEFIKSDDDIPRDLLKLQSPIPDVGLFRVPGVFPTFSKDGKKLAFVDNEFKAVWVADNNGLRVVYETEGPDNVFSPVWNQNPDMDILYVCRGPSFHANDVVDICAIPVAAAGQQLDEQLTDGHNNAFPSTNPEGTKLVFRSTREGPKNLYIMEDARLGEFGGAKITRLTEGDWVDTHCQWSPNGEWIVFASTRDKPSTAPPLDNGLDPGYYAIYLLKVSDPSVTVRVIGSGKQLAGHVNHPFFSPDGGSIVVVSDLAAVSCDPIQLPLFLHSVRPYGDIFTVDIDTTDIAKNKDVKKFTRVTHSRYENSTASWTLFSTKDPNAAWNLLFISDKGSYAPECPYMHADGGESFQMTGHLCIPRRCC